MPSLATLDQLDAEVLCEFRSSRMFPLSSTAKQSLVDGQVTSVAPNSPIDTVVQACAELDDGSPLFINDSPLALTAMHSLAFGQLIEARSLALGS